MQHVKGARARLIILLTTVDQELFLKAKALAALLVQIFEESELFGLLRGQTCPLKVELRSGTFQAQSIPETSRENWGFCHV